MSLYTWNEVWAARMTVEQEVKKHLPPGTKIVALISELAPLREDTPLPQLYKEPRIKVKTLIYPPAEEGLPISLSSLFDRDLFEYAPDQDAFLGTTAAEIGKELAERLRRYKEQRQAQENPNHLTEEELRQITEKGDS